MRASSRRVRSPCAAALMTSRVSSTMFLRNAHLSSCSAQAALAASASSPSAAGGKRQVPADEAVDVEQHDHALGDRHQAADVFGGGARAELRRRFHFGGVDVDHVGDAVDHDPEIAPPGRCVDRHHDDHGHRGVFDALEREAHAQIDDRDDRAAQVQHAENMRRGMGNLGDRRPTTDLLHAQDVDPIGLVAEHEGQNLMGPAAGTLLPLDRVSGHDCACLVFTAVSLMPPPAWMRRG